MKNIRDNLKKIAWLRVAYHNYLRTGRTYLNVLDTFPAFCPNSGGSYKILSPLTIKTINQFLPSLYNVAQAAGQSVKTISISDFLNLSKNVNHNALGDLFRLYGSDKASDHDYYLVYSTILAKPESVTKILEIGLGTNNTDTPSHMGPYGKPGASLRALRDYLPNCQVLGADIDRRILFTEDRIETHWIDQTSDAAFEELGKEVGSDFDLCIDDGLHSMDANLKSLSFFLPRLKTGGYAVIEDIHPNTEELWKVVALLLSTEYDTHIVRTKSALMFVCRRLE